MATITVGSGLGGFTAIAPQPTYGAGSELAGTVPKAGSPGGTFVTPTRTIYGLKSNKATHDPHIVQGGPYLEYGRLVDIGAAHKQTYIDAKGTMVCDAMSSGFALLFAQAFGSPAGLVATTAPAYELGGANGVTPGGPEKNNIQTWNSLTTYPTAGSLGEVVLEGTTLYENIASGTIVNLGQKPSVGAPYWKALTVWSSKAWEVGERVYQTIGGKAIAYQCIKKSVAGHEPYLYPEEFQVIGAQSGSQFDMQLGVPTTSGELTPWNYHSCVITKMTLVFDRVGLVNATFDWDAQYVENTTALIVPTTSVKAEPFTMGNTASIFEVGPPTKMAKLGGMKKLTVTLEHKMAVDRIYLGNTYKEIPSSNGLIDIQLSAEMDYTSQAKALLETFLKNEEQSLKATAVGSAIGTSGKSNTLGAEINNAFIQTGGEAPLDGPDVVKNTVVLKGTINGNNESPMKGTLITEDSTF